MNTPNNVTKNIICLHQAPHKRPLRKVLAFIILTSPLLLIPETNAAPQGGNITAGSGNISQTGLDTTITQNTQNLAIDWNSFNVRTNEHVQFVQPSSKSIALNRIMDHNGSRIHGQIDANGHVILMNPNGVFFGKNAKVDVGGLVASGLNIDTSAFMNGDLVFTGLDGTRGAVVNRGIINAATGGNVALLGKTVINRGLISANVGNVALASGNQSVITFDDTGLLGVSINQATLDSELGATQGKQYNVKNTGDIKVTEGKILLNASVSEDLFSQAVNHTDLHNNTQATLHTDGSFTLGAGHSVINTGTLEATRQVIITGDNVTNKGTITSKVGPQGALAAHQLESHINIQAHDDITLFKNSTIETNNKRINTSPNHISLKAAAIKSQAGAQIKADGDLTLDGLINVTTADVSAANVKITSIGNVRQKGAMTVSKNLHLLLAGDASVMLTNTGNDFNTLTMDSSYVSNTRIRESNDLQLGNIRLWDSTLRIDATGTGATISQLENTHIDASDTGLYLNSHNIVLGENNSSTRMYNSLIDLRFTQHINTNQSLDLSGGFNFSAADIRGTNGINNLRLTGTPEIDLAATMDDSSSIQIETMTGRSATLETIGHVTQTGAINLSNVLDISLPVGGTVELNNVDNNLNAITMDLGYVSYVNITDTDTLTLRDMALSDSTVILSTTGKNSTISQSKNSHITGGDTSLELHANTIRLGAKGTSSIELHNIGILDLYFDKKLSIDGLVSLGSNFASLHAYGTDASNRFIFGENAELNIDADFTDHLISLGKGNDKAFLYSDFTVPLFSGEGSDMLYISDASIHYDWQDYDNTQDIIHILTP